MRDGAAPARAHCGIPLMKFLWDPDSIANAPYCDLCAPKPARTRLLQLMRPKRPQEYVAVCAIAQVRRHVLHGRPGAPFPARCGHSSRRAHRPPRHCQRL